MENQNLDRLGYLFAADFYGRHLPEAKWKRSEIEALAAHIAKSIRITFDLVQDSVKQNADHAFAALNAEERQPYQLLIKALFETMDHIEITDPTLVQAVERFQEVLKGIE